MARIRSLKPEFWDDRKLARSVSRDARMLYMGMWNQADEHERLNGDVVWLKGRIFPYDDDIETGDVEAFLDELERASRIVRYEAEGDPFIHLPKLGKHQRLEPAKVESKIPAPPETKTCNDLSVVGTHESAPRADQSEPDSESSTLLYVAGSMEHVAAQSTAQTRPRDELFERLVHECGIEAKELTKASRGPINNALSQLREVEATPNQITVRARRYRERWQEIPITPSALVKHWASLGDMGPPSASRAPNAMTALSTQNRSPR